VVVHRQEENLQRERGRCWVAARVTKKTGLICLSVILGFYLFMGWAFSPNYTNVLFLFLFFLVLSLSFFLLCKKNLDTKLNNK
jgi:hypothetical protein